MFSAITVFPIVAFVLAMYLIKGTDKVFRVLYSAVVAVVTFTFTAMACVTMDSTVPATSSIVEVIEKDKVKIVALSTSSSSEGSFFLASGRIEGQTYYLFYFETLDGGRKLTKLPTDNVTLYEDDRKDAFLVNISRRRKRDDRGWVFDFFAPPFFRDFFDRKSGEYAIHLPKGSVKEEIRLDL